MCRNIKLQRGALQAEREYFILADVSRNAVFFFLSPDVCYHDLKMIYGKSSAEASWSTTNLKRPRRWGHYLHAVSSFSSFPKITAVNFLFYLLVLKRHQRFLSFLSSLCLVAFWFFNLLRAVMLCLQYSVTTSHREEHSKVSHFSFAGRSEKMTFDTVEYISFHVFC